MPDCEEAVYSNDYFDFIAEKEYLEDLSDEDYCIQTLDSNYASIYYPMSDDGRQMNVEDFSYRVIPKCFGLLNNVQLGESGILKVRDQPNLALTGRGVLMGFIDTEECVILLSGHIPCLFSIAPLKDKKRNTEISHNRCNFVRN